MDFLLRFLLLWLFVGANCCITFVACFGRPRGRDLGLMLTMLVLWPMAYTVLARVFSGVTQRAINFGWDKGRAAQAQFLNASTARSVHVNEAFDRLRKALRDEVLCRGDLLVLADHYADVYALRIDDDYVYPQHRLSDDEKTAINANNTALIDAAHIFAKGLKSDGNDQLFDASGLVG